jgi:tetratricopeptide (TPR) repeat protein
VQRRTRARRLLSVSCLALALTVAAHAAAEAPSAGGPALRQARAAWDRGALDTAEPLYREAIEKGGLAPNELLEGYVRLGAIRAALGKKDQAVAAFRAASILDASFAVPSEAGSKGPALAERAKKDTAKIGSLKVSLKAPKETPAGKSFHVTAQIDAAHIPIVAKVALVAREGTSGKESTLEAKPEDSVDFEVPADMTLPGASLVLRVDALDKNANRLGSAEEKVKTPEGAPTKASSGAGASTSEPATSSATRDENVRKGGSFWSSPWPYVIGGVALIGAGTAVYFGTRPSDDVSIGQIGVRTR